MSTKRLIYFALGGATALTVIAAPAAAAHVTVQPGEATKGGYAKLAFRVPNESDTAGTIKLEVTFPLDTPLASVRTKPMPGWTAEIRKEKLATPIKSGHGAEITEAVRTITWTAQQGVRVGPGEFTEFEVSGGPMPENADRLLLPAIQTYDDGKVVAWDAPPPADGAEESEHPAPVLKLTSGPADGNGAASSGADTGAGDAAGSGNRADAAARTGGTDSTARWLGGTGLLVGALGVGLAAGAMIANRRRGAGGAHSAGPNP